MLPPIVRALIGVFLALSFAGAADLLKVTAILEEHCLKCHNSSVKMSGLSLASAADAGKGGQHGPVIVPGKPDESAVVRMISGAKPKMPMQGTPLSAEQVAVIRAWIEDGAHWPDDLRVDRNKAELWSLKPLSKPAVPRSDSPWVRTDIDAFVLARLQATKLAPSPEADRPTLIRRLTYDLHGLPPTWEEIRAFAADRSPDAYESWSIGCSLRRDTESVGAGTGSTSCTTASRTVTTRTSPGGMRGPIATM
jgi:cytochrome c551/c552